MAENETPPAPLSSFNASSLVDLKAELYRKQEDFKRQKLQSDNAGYIKGRSSTAEKKPSLFSKKNAGVSQRAEKDYEDKVEEEDVLEKSRRIMKKKAQLYEQMSSGREIPDEDGSGLYLVDFQKKSIDSVMERRERERREEEERERREVEEEQSQLREPVPAAETEEDEWIDFVDALGRSRRCLMKDLPELKRQDEALQDRQREKNKGSKDFQQLRDKVTLEPELMSADMRREVQRGDWEREELVTMETEKAGPVHYADVQHNEIRTHGVGFFQFAKEETTRQEQMGDLHKLRQQTVDERSKRDRIKEKRKAALDARLAKVKQRKKMRDSALGLDVEDPEEKPEEEEIGPKLTEKVEKQTEPLTRDDEWRKTADITREWDKGKQKSLETSEKQWLETQRSEREDEFAPPSFYYDKQPKMNVQHNRQAKPATKGLSESPAMDNSAENVSTAQYEEAKWNSDKLLQEVKSSLFGNILPETIPGKDSESVEELPADGQNQTCQNVPEGFNPNVPPPQFSQFLPPTHVDIRVPPPQIVTNIALPQIDLNVLPPQIDTNVPPPQTGTNIATSQVDQNIIPPKIDTTVPPPQIDTNCPAPQNDTNIAPPPVCMTVPPPTGTPSVWIPDTRLPPPGIQTGSADFLQQTQPLTDFTVNQSVGSQQTITSQQSQPVVQHFTPSAAIIPATLEKPKFVPKMSIIDTRLVRNQDDL